MRGSKIYWLIFIVALILRLSWIFISGSYVHPEVWEQEEIATNLLNGSGFMCMHLGTVYHSLTQPLYPLFCAVVYFVTGHSYVILELLQAFISAFICIVIFNIASIIFGKYTAIISALLLAFHPGIIIYTAKLHPLIFDILFVSLVVLAFLKIRLNFSLRNRIYAGLVSGLCVLSRSTVSLFLPFAIAWLIYYGDYPKRKVITGGFLILFMAFLVVLPWQIRNYIIHKQFVFIQSTTEETLWLTNNPNASGSNYLSDGRIALDAASPEFLEKLYSLDEMGQRKFFHEQAHDFIKANPLRYVLSFMKRFYYSWWFSPQSGIEYPGFYLLIYKFFYGSIVIFAILGIFSGISCGTAMAKQGSYLLLSCLLSMSFAQSLFYVEGRHRWGVEPLLLIFTANGLFHFKDYLKYGLSRYSKKV